jgi:2'-5' RNA ligase
MPSVRYALVAYIRSPVTAFVENLRRELHPALPHHAAHLTLLPPRTLHGTESDALHMLEQICGSVEPFEVTLGEMQSFVPTTSTVYIGVTQGAYRMEELHRQLDQQILAFTEEWPYVPHLTIAKMNNERDAAHAVEIAREWWRNYIGSRRILLDRLTFVREQAPDHWVDLAPVPLGGSLVSH